MHLGGFALYFATPELTNFYKTKPLKYGIEPSMQLNVGSGTVNSVFAINEHQFIATTTKEIVKFEGTTIKASVERALECAVYVPPAEMIVGITYAKHEFIVLPINNFAKPELQGQRTEHYSVFHVIYSKASDSIITFGDGIKVWKFEYPDPYAPLSQKRRACKLTLVSKLFATYDAPIISPPVFDYTEERFIIPTSQGIQSYDLRGNPVSLLSKKSVLRTAPFSFFQKTSKILTTDGPDVFVWNKFQTCVSRYTIPAEGATSIFMVDKENAVIITTSFNAFIMNLKNGWCSRPISVQHPVNRIFIINNQSPTFVVANGQSIAFYNVTIPWRTWQKGVSKPVFMRRYPKKKEAARIFVLCENNLMRFFSPKTRTQLTTALAPSSAPIKDIIYSRNHIDELYVLLEDGTVHGFDTLVNPSVENLEIDLKVSSMVSISNNQPLFAIGTPTGELSICSGDKLEITQTIPISVNQLPIQRVLYYGNKIACVTSEEIVIVDATSYKVLIHHKATACGLMRMHNNIIYIGKNTGAIDMLEVRERSITEKHTPIRQHDAPITSLTFAQTFWVSTSRNGDVKVWDYKNNQCIFCLQFQVPIFSCEILNGTRGILVGTEGEIMLIPGNVIFKDEMDEEDFSIDNFDHLHDYLASDILKKAAMEEVRRLEREKRRKEEEEKEKKRKKKPNKRLQAFKDIVGQSNNQLLLFDQQNEDSASEEEEEDPKKKQEAYEEEERKRLLSEMTSLMDDIPSPKPTIIEEQKPVEEKEEEVIEKSEESTNVTKKPKKENKHHKDKKRMKHKNENVEEKQKYAIKEIIEVEEKKAPLKVKPPQSPKPTSNDHSPAPRQYTNIPSPTDAKRKEEHIEKVKEETQLTPKKPTSNGVIKPSPPPAKIAPEEEPAVVPEPVPEIAQKKPETNSPEVEKPEQDGNPEVDEEESESSAEEEKPEEQEEEQKVEQIPEEENTKEEVEETEQKIQKNTKEIEEVPKESKIRREFSPDEAAFIDSIKATKSDITLGSGVESVFPFNKKTISVSKSDTHITIDTEENENSKYGSCNPLLLDPALENGPASARPAPFKIVNPNMKAKLNSNKYARRCSNQFFFDFNVFQERIRSANSDTNIVDPKKSPVRYRNMFLRNDKGSYMSIKSMKTIPLPQLSPVKQEECDVIKLVSKPRRLVTPPRLKVSPNIKIEIPKRSKTPEFEKKIHSSTAEELTPKDIQDLYGRGKNDLQPIIVHKVAFPSKDSDETAKQRMHPPRPYYEEKHPRRGNLGDSLIISKIRGYEDPPKMQGSNGGRVKIVIPRKGKQ